MQYLLMLYAEEAVEQTDKAEQEQGWRPIEPTEHDEAVS